MVFADRSAVCMVKSCGRVLAGTPIAVDFWSARHCPPSVHLFFLTHMHADHIMGLTPSWNRPIYCTPITKKLLLHKFQFTVEDIVHELEVGESHVIRCDNDDTVTVTPIDANHCPGAVMFLFEGDFGRILYTGDFRYSGAMLYDIQLNSLCNGNVDVLYLDNTFCDSRCIFPSREEAIIEIMRIIRSYPDAEIKIGLRNLGKEQMLVNIARSIGEWIGVSRERYKVLEILCMPDVFQVSSSCRIQVVMMSEITDRRMTDWNHVQQTIAVIPTAIGIALTHSSFPQRDDVHVIPYSDHSSYEELQQFVSFVKPRKIYPIILGPDMNDRLSCSLPNRADMSCFPVREGDDDQLHADGNSVDVMSEQQASMSSSCSTDKNESATKITQPRTRKKSKQKGGFSFKNKTQMGVVFLSSQSPVKRTADATMETVVSAADSAGIIPDQSGAESDTVVATPTKVICSDSADTIGDTTADRNKEDAQCLPVQCDSAQLASDKSLLNSTGSENDLPSSNNRASTAIDFDLLDNAWMLQLVQPLLAREADRIIFERRSLSRSFRK